VARDRQALLWQRDAVIAPLLQRLGWQREPTKGCWEPSQEFEFLGVGLDLRRGLFRAPAEKVRGARAMIEACMRRGQMSRRELAGVVGTVNFLARAVPMVRPLLREAYAVIGTERSGWGRKVVLTPRAREDLQAAGRELLEHNGAPMWRPSQVAVVHTDASQDGWGATYLHHRAAGKFSAEEAMAHINHKEMMAVVRAVRTFAQALAGRRVEFRTDSVVARAYLAKGGGPDLAMTTMVKEVWAVLTRVDAAVYSAVWVKGCTHNTVADALSRWVDLDDWRVKRPVVRMVQERLGACTVDRFASEENAVLPRFNSLLECPGTEAVDAFSQWWGGELNWLVPPVNLVGRVITQVIEQQAEGIIVVPWWKAQPWWPQLLALWEAAVPLGSAREAFEPGASGAFEPGRRADWRFVAVRIRAQRC